MTRSTLRVHFRAILLAAFWALPGCTKSSAVNKSDQAAARVGPLAVVNGLASPEAAVFDPIRDVYFVSNMNGDAGVKDGNGFISRIRPDGVLDSLHFIQGGRNGVTLNAPMGSRIEGDTLWVLDVDVLRGFDARTGTPAQPILVDRVTGQPITDATHKNAAGPAAGARVKKRLGASRKISEPKSSPSKASRPEPTPATASAIPARRTSPRPRS